MINREEALDQIGYLRDLVQMTRMRVAVGYPYFILWGILWICGYLAPLWVQPEMLSLVWAIVGTIGGVSSAVIGLRANQKEHVPTSTLSRQLGWLSSVLAGSAAIGFTIMMLVTRELAFLNIWWPLQVGVIYLANGVFMGRELIWIGGWLVGAALISLLMPVTIQTLFLSFAGGGGLLFSGILLRRQVQDHGR